MMKPWLVVPAVALGALLLLRSAAPQQVLSNEELSRYRNLGKAFYENPTTQNEAVEAFRKALQLAPNSAREQLNYGLALLRAGKMTEGVAQLEAVQKRDPELPHTLFNLGIVYKKQGEHEKAITQFERMVQLVPGEPISHYNLGTLYKLIGRQAEAVAEFETAAKLDPGLAAAHFQLYNAYRTSRRADEAQRELEIFQRIKKLQEGAAIPEDVEWSAYAEILDIMQDAALPKPSDALRFQTRTGTAVRASATAGDYNNDGALDDCAAIKSPEGSYSHCLWLDYDHDYDLDLLRFGDRSVLLRNQGPAGFAERTDIPLAASAVTGATALRLVADTKGIDFVVAYATQPALLYRDHLQGVFKAGKLPIEPGAKSLSPADLDNDGWIDLVYTDGASILISWNREGSLQAPVKIADGGAPFALADLDNRGILDIALSGSLIRNLGGRQFAPARKVPETEACKTAIETADVDKDGRIDFVCGTLHVINRTATPHAWIGVNLQGVKNLKLAQGSEVEVKAGQRYQKAIYNGRPLIFGLGSEKVADTVRITWPNGLIQNEIKQASGKVYTYQEAQRLSGSCPMIWSWNGREFEYITDVLGVAPLGASAGDGEYFPVDHDEYIQIPGTSLVPVDGEYEIRITEELSEVAYLDQIKLIAIDHPSSTSIYTNDKFKGPPFPEFRLFGVNRRLKPVAASDHAGRDVLATLLVKDQSYPDTFPRDLSGVGALHHIDIDFGSAAPRNRSILVLSGWVDWADGSTFLGVSQQGRGGLIPPYLQVKDAHGNWVTVIEDMGMPAGKPKTIVVDLTGRFLSASREVRIVTNLCVYWDEIFLSEDTAEPETLTRAAPLRTAELRFRGFSPVTVHPERRQPERFSYTAPRPVSMWNPTPGLYTRYGDVRPLAVDIDDKFIVMGSGDEIRLRFDAASLGPPKHGWTRDFLLLVDGWAKDRDANTAHSQSTDPLPFHKMSRFPYPASEAYPDDSDHRAYRANFNTRPALRFIGPLAQRLRP
jgi:tetratricopeptide (TPR) repeat protein